MASKVINTILLQDCLKGMNSMSEESIDICVTSPPYNINIKYGVYEDNKPRSEYMDWLSEVFSSIKRVLKKDGHFFLNVGYSNIDPWLNMDVAQVARKHLILQNHINWVKSIYISEKTDTKSRSGRKRNRFPVGTCGHFKPVNSKRFISPTWESLFHFTKTGNVPVDKLAVGVPYEYYKDAVRAAKHHHQNEKTKQTKPNLRCKGNSWFVPHDNTGSSWSKSKYRGNHPAVFPINLVEDCINLSGVKKNSILLDPFMGSGTSALAAMRNDLNYVGFDIDENYINFANDRIAYEIKSTNSMPK
jgi:site-specific DNA-methyltransferase (adenine-specific)